MIPNGNGYTLIGQALSTAPDSHSDHAGYFAKIPTAKALSELPQFQGHRQSNLGAIAPLA